MRIYSHPELLELKDSSPRWAETKGRALKRKCKRRASPPLGQSEATAGSRGDSAEYVEHIFVGFPELRLGPRTGLPRIENEGQHHNYLSHPQHVHPRRPQKEAAKSSPESLKIGRASAFVNCTCFIREFGLAKGARFRGMQLAAGSECLVKGTGNHSIAGKLDSLTVRLLFAYPDVAQLRGIRS
jgi:hypothetical protein